MGLFKDLEIQIRKLSIEYDSQPRNLRKRIHAKGFSKANMNSLLKIADKIDFMLNAKEPPRKKEKQMDIEDFIR